MAHIAVSSTTEFSVLGTIRQAFAAWRQRRDQRLALVGLLALSRQQLDNLGIDILDVTEALHAQTAPAQGQAERRLASAPCHSNAPAVGLAQN